MGRVVGVREAGRITVLQELMRHRRRNVGGLRPPSIKQWRGSRNRSEQDGGYEHNYVTKWLVRTLFPGREEGSNVNE